MSCSMQFFRGRRAAACHAGPLTPEEMDTLGRLLRALRRTTLHLLLAHALLKLEFDADVAIIAALENSTLKFSPTVDVALEHFLLPHGLGFQTPGVAIIDVCNDLRTQQFGIMAGMQAALDGVPCRLAPALLQRRFRRYGFVESVLSMHRRVRLWE